MTYRFIAPALEEYELSLLYYLEEASAKVAADFDEEVMDALASVCRKPFRDREMIPGFRERQLQRFPFALLYTVEGEEIIVFALKHHKRKPDYWKSRIGNSKT